jgi:hypothetical protein
MGGVSFIFFRSISMSSLALAAGLMFSPDTMTFFGNSLGFSGWLLLLLLPLAVIIYWTVVHSFQSLHDRTGNHVVEIQRSLGPRRAAVVLLCGKLPFAVCATAGLVVTAGFVFNEVFVYSFPNFVFAYLLLITIAAINLISVKIAQTAQIIAVAAACLGLLILIGAGLIHLPDGLIMSASKNKFEWRHLAAAVIVLVGFDMGLGTVGNSREAFSMRYRAMVAALIGGGLLIFLWGIASLSVVPSVKLESSTVPYMTMARGALGQNGRYIMGAVVIFGVFGAANSMMHSVSTTVSRLAEFYQQHNQAEYFNKIRAISILFLVGASAFLMAMGIAGEPYLETWIKSGLGLWLFYYILINMLTFKLYLARNASKTGGRAAATLLMKAAAVAGTVFAAFGVVLTEPKPLNMAAFAAVAVGVIVIAVNIVHIGIERTN